MNSLDQERLGEAIAIIANALELLNQDGRERTEQWRRVAKTWMDSRTVVSTPAPESGPIGTRWREIDAAGNVHLDPTPEPPDDPDEGETGPPEVQA